MRRFLSWVGTALMFATVSCDKATADSKEEPSSKQAALQASASASKPEPKKEPVPTAAPSASTEAEQNVTELKIEAVGNKMEFDLKSLEVEEHARVHLVLKNNATLKVMPHNWVLVRVGTEAAVAAAGLNMGEAASYIEEGPDVLAYTPLAGPQETVEVTFTAPAAGKYPYICTVPGHYMVMKGLLTVTPAGDSPPSEDG